MGQQWLLVQLVQLLLVLSDVSWSGGDVLSDACGVVWCGGHDVSLCDDHDVSLCGDDGVFLLGVLFLIHHDASSGGGASCGASYGVSCGASCGASCGVSCDVSCGVSTQLK